jgi:hypothetical protein
MNRFSLGETQFQIPNPTSTSDADKNEMYHKNYVLSITQRSINKNFDLHYAAMTENLKYYDGVQDQDAYKFLTEAEDGEVLPATFINYNSIRTKVDVLVGEMASKGYEIRAIAVNKDAVSRKLDERETMKVDHRLSPIADKLQQNYNLPIGPGSQDLPETEADIDNFFAKSYKEKSEIVMEGMLKYIAKKSNWKYSRIALFRDLIINNRCFGKNEIIDGVPTVRRIDPRLMIFDPNAEDDLLGDSTYWGEVRYMDFTSAAEMYGLTQKELKEAYNSYQQYDKTKMSGNAPASSYSALEGSELKWFKEDRGNALRVLVVTAFWKDTKSFNHKKSKDNYGETHYKRVSDTYAPATNEEIIKKRIPIWRTGTLIGGSVFKQWGEMENQEVDVDTYQPKTPPYFGVIPNYVNYHSVSIVDQLKDLQDLKNITMYNVQLAMARAGSKGFIYDVAQVPEGWDIHNVIKYLKTTGIGFIDSEKDGTQKQFNQFQPLDLSISQSVEQYISIMTMIDEAMKQISGINDEREGNNRPYTPLGVTQSGMAQSNMMTATKFKEFNMFVNNIFNGLAGLGKICWADKEKFASIIGDVGINFLKTDIDLSLDNYGIFVEEAPPALDDKQNFQTLVMGALQQGQLSFVNAMKLLMEDDMQYAVRQLERDIQEQQQQIQEQEMQKQQQIAQMQQQQAQAQAQMSAEKNANEMAKIDKKGEWDMKGKAVDVKSDLMKGKLDFAKDLSLEKIKKKNEKRAQGK